LTKAAIEAALEAEIGKWGLPLNLWLTTVSEKLSLFSRFAAPFAGSALTQLPVRPVTKTFLT
jgi:hypothetical protein